MLKKLIQKITPTGLQALSGLQRNSTNAPSKFNELVCASENSPATQYPSWLHGAYRLPYFTIYESEAYTGDIEPEFIITTTLN